MVSCIGLVTRVSVLVGTGMFLAGVWTVQSGLAEGKNIPEASQIYISPRNGTLEKIHQGTGPLVICIQDAHADSLAQKNIADIIHTLHRNYSIDLVGVEGSSGMVDTSLFSTFPAKKARDLVSQYLLSEGRLTGAELAGIDSERPLQLLGIEDPSLYLANYDSLLASEPTRTRALVVVSKIDKDMGSLMQLAYSPELKEWNNLWEGYEGGMVPLRDMVGKVVEQSKKYAIDLDKFSQWSLYQNLMEREKNQNLDAVEKDRTMAVQDLTLKLNTSDLKELTIWTMQFRVGAVSTADFYRRLIAWMGPQKINYPRIVAYAQYLSDMEKLDRAKLQKEMASIGDLIFSKMAPTKGPQEGIRNAAKTAKVLAGFLRLRSSYADYRWVASHLPEVRASAVLSKLEALCRQTRVPYSLTVSDARTLQDGLDQAIRFYELAVQRNGVLASNCLAQMKLRKRNAGILLAGGFHTEGIVQYLVERHVSVVVVLPKAGTRNVESRYLALLLRKETPYLNIYRRKKQSDVLSGAIGWLCPKNDDSRATALAPTSLFGDAISILQPKFEAVNEDFQWEYVTRLLAGAVVTREMRPSQIGPAWEKALSQRMQELGLSGIIEPGQMVAMQSKHSGVLSSITSIGMCLTLSDGESYVPVGINGIPFVYHMARGEMNGTVEDETAFMNSVVPKMAAAARLSETAVRSSLVHYLRQSATPLTPVPAMPAVEKSREAVEPAA